MLDSPMVITRPQIHELPMLAVARSLPTVGVLAPAKRLANDSYTVASPVLVGFPCSNAMAVFQVSPEKVLTSIFGKRAESRLKIWESAWLSTCCGCVVVSSVCAQAAAQSMLLRVVQD